MDPGSAAPQRSLACPGRRSGGRDDILLGVKPLCSFPPPRHPGRSAAKIRGPYSVRARLHRLESQHGFGSRSPERVFMLNRVIDPGSAAPRALPAPDTDPGGGMTFCLRSSTSARSHLPVTPDEAQRRSGVHTAYGQVCTGWNRSTRLDRLHRKTSLSRTGLWITGVRRSARLRIALVRSLACPGPRLC